MPARREEKIYTNTHKVHNFFGNLAVAVNYKERDFVKVSPLLVIERLLRFHKVSFHK